MAEGSHNLDQLLALISEKQPDLVEFRLDGLNSSQTIEEIGRKKTFAAIATDRSDRDLATKEKLLLAAASAGFEFIDVDLDAARPAVSEVKALGSEAIVSFHHPTKTPSWQELEHVLEAEVKAGGDICKVVTTALTAHDNLSILRFVEENARDTKLVSFAMGQHGVPSRILSPLFGAEFTFASLTDADKTADGQITIDKIRSVWRLLGIQ